MRETEPKEGAEQSEVRSRSEQRMQRMAMGECGSTE
jgi:hypothetical protein